MDTWGINSGFLLVQCFNIFLTAGWPILSLLTILAIRKCQLSDTAQAVWVLIGLIPFLGPIAFLLVKPGNSNNSF